MASVICSRGMSLNEATMEAFRESEVFWCVLLNIISQAFKNNNSCRGEGFINRSGVSSNDISANPVTMVAFSDIRLLWWFLLMICAPHGFYIRWLFISRCARMMKTRSFSEKKIGFDDSFYVTKCLHQIEMSDLLHECA